MDEFFNDVRLREYLTDSRATYGNLHYESLDSQMAVDSYLMDYGGDPKAQGLLAFCVKEGLPVCAMELLECGADINDTFDNCSALHYLHKHNLNDFYRTTQRNLKKLERILIEKGAKDFVKKATSVRTNKLQHTR